MLNARAMDAARTWAVKAAQHAGVTEPFSMDFAPVAGPSRASCIDGAMVLHIGEDRPHRSADFWRYVIAHEVCHLRQFEIGRTAAAHALRAELEIEADRCAAQLLLGQDADVRLGASAARRLNWNRYGHFWTVLCLALGARWPIEPALHAAWGAQLPDMALELDAIAMSSASLALYIYGDEPDFGRRKDYALEFMLKLHSLTNGMAGVDTTIEMPNSYMDAAAINVGLHSLTGQSHKTEKSNRKDRLLTTGVDDPAFGLAIHAFGDAFAHRNDATGAMYRPLQGHMLAGHDPDCTSRHMPAYQTYINELWDVLWKKRSAFFLDADVVSPVRDTPNKSALLYSGVHQFLLSEMTKEDPKEPEKEATQIKDITSYILTNYGIMISFPPDYDGIPFKGIRRDILARIGKATPLSKYKEIAKDWAAQSGGLPLAQKELTFAPLFKELTQALTKTVAPRVLKATMPGAYYIGKWLAIIE